MFSLFHFDVSVNQKTFQLVFKLFKYFLNSSCHFCFSCSWCYLPLKILIQGNFCMTNIGRRYILSLLHHKLLYQQKCHKSMVSWYVHEEPQEVVTGLHSKQYTNIVWYMIKRFNVCRAKITKLE